MLIKLRENEVLKKKIDALKIDEVAQIVELDQEYEGLL